MSRIFQGLNLDRAVLAGVLVVCAACGGSSLVGTYTNPNAAATLDIKADGKATFSAVGQSQTCTYKSADSKLTVTCPEGGDFEFTINGDGSLTSVGTFLGTLQKSKS